MNRFRAAGIVSALTAAFFVSACGGRAANPVTQRQAVDQQVTCRNLADQKKFNETRIADLEDERVDNRIRTLARVPGALIGSPIAAVALADTSRAVYLEIEALEQRNLEIERQRAARDCDAPGATPVAARPVFENRVDLGDSNYGALEPPAAEAADPTASDPTASDPTAAAPTASVPDAAPPSDPARKSPETDASSALDDAPAADTLAAGPSTPTSAPAVADGSTVE